MISKDAKRGHKSNAKKDLVQQAELAMATSKQREELNALFINPHNVEMLDGTEIQLSSNLAPKTTKPVLYEVETSYTELEIALLMEYRTYTNLLIVANQLPRDNKWASVYGMYDVRVSYLNDLHRAKIDCKTLVILLPDWDKTYPKANLDFFKYREAKLAKLEMPQEH